jgi:hypothetical protein
MAGGGHPPALSAAFAAHVLSTAAVVLPTLTTAAATAAARAEALTDWDRSVSISVSISRSRTNAFWSATVNLARNASMAFSVWTELPASTGYM